MVQHAYFWLCLWLWIPFTISYAATKPIAAATDISTSIHNPVSLVNLFIGTTKGGHTFPGATLPHGMVKVGPDTNSPDNHAGYDANPIYSFVGFSQMHDDGTGGSAPLSNFKLWPFKSCGQSDAFEECTTSLSTRSVPRKVQADGLPDDSAEPGYFSTNLTTGIRVELTATRRVALHKYTFPVGTKNPRILLDLIDDGQRSGVNPAMQIDPSTGRIQGSASFSASFGVGGYNAYACVEFEGDRFQLRQPKEFGGWVDDSPVKNITNSSQLNFFFGSQVGGMLTFTPKSTGATSILARVGISLISTAQACANAEEEIPTFDFDLVRAAARAEWNELLGRIQVKTNNVDPEIVSLFYSSVYRTHISPADYTEENPRWTSSEPYYDSLYCNWDTYRTLYSLMALHDPVRFAQIVRGMIDIQRNEGWLPECRGATDQQWIQGGSNGDPILGEFFVKFHEHAAALNVDADALYTALLRDAEDQPPNWDLQGRQAADWKTFGFLPFDRFIGGGANTRHVSRALEYAFDDFAISQVAKILNKTDDAAKYSLRAGHYINNWNATTAIPGREDIVGMMQLRLSDGSFAYTDPRHCSVNDPTHSTCFLDSSNRDGFYESSPIVYSQYVPQDTAKLILLQGGNEKFIDRLNFIFDENYFDSTDEPSQQIPFMYHYANRPGLSTQASRQVIAQSYNTSTNGLPGNDDSGAMGSYVAFFLAGLYPLPATRQFLISSPYFPEISFFNPVFGKTTTIRTRNFRGNPENGTGGTVFVKSVKINGEPWKSNCFIEWDHFEQGSIIELELTDDINVSCGKDAGALPPSLSTGGYD